MVVDADLLCGMTCSRSEIIEAATRMAVLTDSRQWADLASVFTPTVRLDYTALLGGEPLEVAGGEVGDGWARALGSLITQHLVTNHLVTITGGHAVVTASFQATHVAPTTSQRWVLGGDYRYELALHDGQWRISTVTLTPRWETGDRSILGPSD
jgi:hypothetical protein